MLYILFLGKNWSDAYLSWLNAKYAIEPETAHRMNSFLLVELFRTEEHAPRWRDIKNVDAGPDTLADPCACHQLFAVRWHGHDSHLARKASAMTEVDFFLFSFGFRHLWRGRFLPANKPIIQWQRPVDGYWIGHGSTFLCVTAVLLGTCHLSF